jgi:cyclic pyranopterin phosphate synthase
VPDGKFVQLSHGDILTYEEIERTVRVAARAGTGKIRLTGGEPLVRKGIERLVEVLAAVPGVAEVCLTTNGSLLARHARALRSAGLRRVTVSLDTLRRDRFLRIASVDSLDAVLEGIQAALDAGLRPLKANAVVLRGVNDDEVGDFLRFARERDVEVRFIEYMPLGGGDPWRERFLPAAEIARRIAEAAGEALVELPPDGPARRRWALPGGGRVGLIPPVSEPFCGSCDRLRVTANGSLRACLIRGGEVDLRALLRSGAGDDRVEEALRRAWALKPADHGLEGGEGAHASECRGMRGIGG